MSISVLLHFQSEELLSPYKVFRKGVQKLIESLIKYIKHGQELSLPERYNIPSIIEYLQPLPKISAGSNICLILDDTMCYPSMRYSYYQLARKYALGFGQIYFETPLDICLMRNSKRLGHERIDEQVIANMKEILKPPDVSCNPWEKHVFKITNGEFSTTSLSSLVSFINTCTEDIVPPLVAEGDREEGSRISVEDVIHQSDLILRQLVKSQIAANAGGSLVKEVAAQTNRCRKSLLNYLRAHAAELSDLLSESSPLPCRNPESALYRYIETLFLTQLHGH
ncbi:L-seryl-tRNA(Sec) kinase-like isoform X2 [Watersipora subatra]|uniref:L-seryl-tRNA(Sec) kinase-like isoform X2 n=1 Tax=Watersipora subatra TaxID=2589382 RepID=UPI00355C6783